jgi:hypothetical protein
VRATALSALLRFPAADAGDLLADLTTSDPDPGVRGNAILVLSDQLDARTVNAVLAERDDDVAIRNLAIFVAGRLTDAGVVSAAGLEQMRSRLYAAVESPRVQTRLCARAALIALHDGRGIDGLWADIAHTEALESPGYRWLPLLNLAAWRPPDFDAEPLRSLLHDADPAMRAKACLVAGQAGARQLRDDLQSLTRDDTYPEAADKTVGACASEALDRIAGKRPMAAG